MPEEDIEYLRQRLRKLEEENKQLKNSSSSYDINDLEEQCKLVKSVPFIFIIIDNDKKIIKANDLANDFFKLFIPSTSKSLSGVFIESILDNNIQFQSLLKQAIKGNKVSRELRLHQSQAQSVWLECHLNPVFGGDARKVDKIVFTAFDISQRKANEDTLRQSEAWLKQIYGDLPVMIYTIDDQAILRHANKKLLEKTGYNREEIIGKKIKLFLSEKSKELVFGYIIPEFLQEGKIINKEIQLLKKDGELMDVRISAVEAVGERGEFIGLTVVEDISEIKYAQDALKETDEQYRKLVEELPDVVAITDLQGKVEFVSPNVDTLSIDIPDNNFLGSNIHSWIKPAFHEEFSVSLQQLIEGKRYVIGVYDLRSVDEGTIYVEIRTTLIHDAKGKPRGYISILRDITKEKKAQDELIINEQILHQIYGNSADIIWMMDKNDKITFVSKAAEKILGYTPGEAKQLPLEALQSPEEFEKKKAVLRNRFPKKRNPGQVFEPAHLEIKHIHKNGSTVWTEMRISPLYNEGNEFSGFIGIIRDNSERKAQELAIRESQELYRSLIELSPEGIIIINKGKIEFANRAFINMLKAEREKQIIEQNFLDLVLPGDHSKMRNWFKRVEQYKAKDEMILVELERFDGTQLIAEVMATPITIRGNKSAQLFVRDVTQRILTEKELNRERELNESLIKYIPDFIFFKDTSGKFLKINRSLAKTYGLKNPEEIIGMSDIDFFGIEHFRQTLKEEQQIIKTKKPLIGAIRKETFVNKKFQWASVTKMPLYDTDRNVIGIYGVVRDITKQKQSEEELRKREERFRHLFEQVQVGMAIINSKFEIQEVNNALCDILHYKRKELINSTLYAYCEKLERAVLKEQIIKISFEEASHSRSECKLFMKNGDSVHVIIQLIKLDNTEEVKDQFLCQVVDINDRKIAEEQLLVRNNELNNFVYKVSHDLRAPLLSVKGLINLMGMEKTHDMQDKYIGMIEKRVERLDEFIRDILSHSRNLNTEISIGEVDMEEILENCFAQMQYHTNAKRIEKKIVVKGAKLFSDSKRLQEVLRNLISNAVIYSSKERENSFIHVNVRCGTKTCKIIVEDNGLGIKKAYLDKIFGMFYRANDKVEGSGIGLYIVEQSVQKLGGKVKVESKLNKGATFTITLPNNTPK